MYWTSSQLSLTWAVPWLAGIQSCSRQAIATYSQLEAYIERTYQNISVIISSVLEDTSRSLFEFSVLTVFSYLAVATGKVFEYTNSDLRSEFRPGCFFMLSRPKSLCRVEVRRAVDEPILEKGLAKFLKKASTQNSDPSLEIQLRQIAVALSR